MVCEFIIFTDKLLACWLIDEGSKNKALKMRECLFFELGGPRFMLDWSSEGFYFRIVWFFWLRVEKFLILMYLLLYILIDWTKQYIDHIWCINLCTAGRGDQNNEFRGNASFLGEKGPSGANKNIMLLYFS